jgi:hypothetical protein
LREELRTMAKKMKVYVVGVKGKKAKKLARNLRKAFRKSGFEVGIKPQTISGSGKNKEIAFDFVAPKGFDISSIEAVDL